MKKWPLQLIAERSSDFIWVSQKFPEQEVIGLDYNVKPVTAG
jgi:hypothetical protein